MEGVAVGSAAEDNIRKADGSRGDTVDLSNFSSNVDGEEEQKL